MTSHRVIEYNMVQSAIDFLKTPFHIDVCREKPNITSLSWDKWTQQRKMALLAKEAIQLETLLRKEKAESVESLYEHLIEQAENCSLGIEENTLIRDTFILNMQDHDTQ